MRLVILGTLFEFLQLFYIKTSYWELQCLQNTKSNTLYEAFLCIVAMLWRSYRHSENKQSSLQTVHNAYDTTL